MELVSLKLGRSPSKLKMELKDLHIKRWPYRRVNAIKEKMRCLKIKDQQYIQEQLNSSCSNLASFLLPTQNFASPYKQQLSMLEQELHCLIEGAAASPSQQDDNISSTDEACSPPHSPALSSEVLPSPVASSLYKMSLRYVLN